VADLRREGSHDPETGMTMGKPTPGLETGNPSGEARADRREAEESSDDWCTAANPGNVTMRLPSALALVVASLAAAPGLAAGASSHAPKRLLQTGPEYAIATSALVGAFQQTKPLYTCSGIRLTGVTEALGGPEAVQQLGLELVAQALGSPEKPWPANKRAFTYEGRRYVPDFVKARTIYVVDTARRLTPTREIRDLQAIARRRGWDLVIVTRTNTAVAPTLSRAASRSQPRASRLGVVRCV